ncbi:Regulator of telomere elongation helicase 1 [Bulinus truncatus]|nr:Regulator of telomere elongation helicase 1 [Bulinus truncatus]
MEQSFDLSTKESKWCIREPNWHRKTLSLLCASLAWQESHKAQVELNKQTGLASAISSQTLQNVDLNKISQNLQTATGSTWGSNEFLVPRIIYASRTHSQISQAVNELKRTAYSYVKSSVIGSREQLCIHQQVQQQMNNAAKVHLCRAKVTARNCHFYNNIEEFKKKSEIRKVLGNIVDIEDLIKTGHKTKTCPYYMARELKSDSDIVFMPYNYLLDNKSRKAHGVELQGSVIIFDEAHNLEKICEESASFDLSSLDIATAIEETTKLAEKIAHLSETEAEFSQIEDSAIIPDFNLEDIIRLKQTLLEIEEKLDKIEISSSGKTLPGNFIFEFLSQVNITWSTKNVLLDVLDKMTSFLGNDEGNSLLHSKGSGLTKFSDCLKTVFNQEPGDSLSLSVHQANISQHFRVYIQKKESASYSKRKIDSWATTNDPDKKVERILSYWCFSPGHTMKDLVAHGVKGEIPNKEPESVTRKSNAVPARNVCHICDGQIFIRQDEWEEHMNCKKHKHKLKLIKREREKLSDLLAARTRQMTLVQQDGLRSTDEQKLDTDQRVDDMCEHSGNIK